MEREGHIFVKNFFSLALISMIMLACSGCGGNSKMAIVSVQPAMQQPYVFTVYSSGLMKVQLCNFTTGDLRDSSYTADVSKENDIQIAKDDLNEIKTLIDCVAKNSKEATQPGIGDDTSEVHALISGKLYKSLFVRDYKNTTGASYENLLDKAVLDLSYKLIELSPMKV
ncbi:MAG: hypothetical protein Q8865_10605 [Bacillota bacterium]|nr:hypothetical protein [Bacillota bacterium]